MIRLLAALALLSGPVLADELVGEWSSAGECDEMRVIYTDDGRNVTRINAGGDWVEISDFEYTHADGVIEVRGEGRVDHWNVAELTADRLRIVNQDPEAAELGAGEREFERCGPRG